VTFPFERTSLWQRTLGADDAEFHRERETLRHAFFQFRETVEPLAGEISRSMPMFTDHSIAHIDALWDVASIICGDEYEINPAESFVLGGAFLLHDLGMGLVAYPGGIEEVKSDPLFDDMYTAAFTRLQSDARGENEGEIARLAIDETVASILRLRHAKRAERLVTEFFQLPNRQGFYLLQDAQLRQAYGSLIGRLAHSHWWDIEILPKQFGQVVGSLADHPYEWHIDPLKIACILRLADAAHIDSRRAPTFLHAFRNPIGPSREHWDFQHRLMRPRRVGDRLEYTSAGHFKKDEAGAWWLAYETIRMIDQQLRRVDALCADLKRPRFAARSIAGADTPARLANYIPTDEWEPVDARLRVSNVPNLVATLGGSALYGENNLAAIRELIANAADATRARQTMHGGSDAAVKITLRKEQQSGSEAWWIEVADQGIGMDSSTLVNALTDFGHSHWQSSDMLARFPRLLAQGFRSTGRFGIGFYAIFMVADEVSVRSLKWFDQPENTHVLEFKRGLQARPLLRRAEEDERLQFGGTVVSARLRSHPTEKSNGILWRYDLLRQVEMEGEPKSVDDIFHARILTLCACADVDIETQGTNESSPRRIVRANDWKFIRPRDLLDRMKPIDYDPKRDQESWDYWREIFDQNCSPITDASGEIVGRIMLQVDPRQQSEDYSFPFTSSPPSAVTYIGGLQADSTHRLIGVLVGEPSTADRSTSTMAASIQDFERWAPSQTALLASCPTANHGTQRAAHLVRYLNQPAPLLPCGYTNEGDILLADLGEWAKQKNQIVFLSTGSLLAFRQSDGKLRFMDHKYGDEVIIPENVLVIDSNIDMSLIRLDRPDPESDPDLAMITSSGHPVENLWASHELASTPRFLFKEIARSWEVDVTTLASSIQHLGMNSATKEESWFEMTTANGAVHRTYGLQLTRPESVQR